MCAIAGIMRFDGNSIATHTLDQMLHSLSHRGRDYREVKLGSRNHQKSAEITLSAEIALGHNRLSIIDIQAESSQPMFYADKNLCITYNGEIYNYLELKKILEEKKYHFKTHSDTEVLLAAYHYWGKSFLNHLNGMFAFAIWDEKNKFLFCARDPVGIKPFYYRLNSNYFGFASESFALLHLEKSEINYSALTTYLMSMYVATQESIFSGVEKLPPGHSLTLHPNGRFQLDKYWCLSEFEQHEVDASSLEHLDSLIKTSIYQQLRSDVPVGGFLSGGIDSGLITAIAAPKVKKYFTYSVGYDESLTNELPYAKMLAQEYQTQHREALITATDAMNLLEQALSVVSEPIADPAMAATYLLSQLAAEDGVKVLLNGTGGDEIFAGYTRYNGQLSHKRRLLNNLPAGVKKIIGFLPMEFKNKLRMKMPAFDMLFSTGGSYELAAKMLGTKPVLKFFLQKLSKKFTHSAALPLLYQQMQFDLHVYLPEQLLFMLDQMTMAQTVEGRVPLLDKNIIAYAFKFFAKDHMDKNQTKTILKSIALPYLGHDYVKRKKQGFADAGSTQWWIKYNFKHFKEVISNLQNIPYFDNLNLNDYALDHTLTDKKANEMFILYCYAKWHERIKSLNHFTGETECNLMSV